MNMMKMHYCSRCHVLVPLNEWKLSSTGNTFKHVGPMRDHHIDKFVESDEDGSIACEWIEPIPTKVR